MWRPDLGRSQFLISQLLLSSLRQSGTALPTLRLTHPLVCYLSIYSVISQWCSVATCTYYQNYLLEGNKTASVINGHVNV